MLSRSTFRTIQSTQKSLFQFRTAATAPARKVWGTATATAKSKPAAAQAAAPIVSSSGKNWGSANDIVRELDEADLEAGMDDLLPEIPPPSTSTTAVKPTSSPSSSLYPEANTTFPTSPLGTAPVPLHAHTNPIELPPNQSQIDWTTSFHGMSSQAVSEKAADILMRPLEAKEIEIKPDGLLYLPEILYRRILHKAFGPGGWGMVPRGEMTVMKNMVTREWGLVAGGRLVSVARGEQTFFDPSGLPTATEGCKSNALMRCCKDLGIASELWDPSFIREYKSKHCVEAWTEHATTKKKARRWRKKGNKFDYPLIEQK